MPPIPNGISAAAPPRCGWTDEKREWESEGAGEWEGLRPAPTQSRQRNRPDIPSGTRERVSVSLSPSPPRVFLRGDISMKPYRHTVALCVVAVCLAAWVAG